MASDNDFFEYILHDVFAGIDGITSRPMFGGYGFYKDGIFFALIAYGKLYFKVGKSNQKDYQEYGSKPFVYTGHKNKKPVTMSYWEVPADILEEKQEIEAWIQKAVKAKQESETTK